LDTHPTLANPVFKNCQKLVDFYHPMSKAIQKIVFSYHIQAGGEYYGRMLSFLDA
jgi:hypothetical protein